MRLDTQIKEGDIIQNSIGEEFVVCGYDEQRQIVRFFRRHAELKPIFERPLYVLNTERFTYKTRSN